MTPGYESSFGLAERPFSLTADPKYFYRSRAHGRAIETLTFGLRSRERLLLLTGDPGVGKTILCRTLVAQLRRRGLAAYVPSPLLNPPEFFRLLLREFNAPAAECAGRATGLRDTVTRFLANPMDGSREATIVIDEAHLLPPTLVEHVLALSRIECEGRALVQIVLAGEGVPGQPGRLGRPDLDDALAAKARLRPLGREECGAYVNHRLAIARGAGRVTFSPRGLNLVFALSAGTPRLVNLLCERALQDAAAAGVQHVDQAIIETAATTLDLLRARPRRFRWFAKRAS